MNILTEFARIYHKSQHLKECGPGSSSTCGGGDWNFGTLTRPAPKVNMKPTDRENEREYLQKALDYHSTYGKSTFDIDNLTPPEGDKRDIKNENKILRTAAQYYKSVVTHLRRKANRLNTDDVVSRELNESLVTRFARMYFDRQQLRECGGSLGSSCGGGSSLRPRRSSSIKSRRVASKQEAIETYEDSLRARKDVIRRKAEIERLCVRLGIDPWDHLII
jgi:hypothetical protein